LKVVDYTMRIIKRPNMYENYLRKALLPLLLATPLIALILVVVPNATQEAYAHGGGGNEGCTPGFWRNHLEVVSTIVIPGFGGRTADEVTLNEFFDTNLPSNIGDLTLAEAVTIRGNTELNQSLRQAVSALFNSLTIDSRFSDFQAKNMFRDDIDPYYQDFPGIPNDDDLESIKDAFDTANNLGCLL
jgi:hypothetical protein